MEKGYDLNKGARRLEEVRFSKIRMIMDRVADMRGQGMDVLALSAGEPDFNTPDPIKEKTVEAIRNNYTHYGSNRGLPALRNLLAEKIWRETGVRYDPEVEILLTTGGAEALNNALIATVDPGDEVIIFSPAFITYENLVRMCGGRVVELPLSRDNGFRINLQQLERAITPRTKMLIMNNPNNPTGAVYTKESLEGVCRMAREHNFLILSDEMYSGLLYEDVPFYSIASFPGMKERSIIVNGFSKTYAMTGWRMGYLTAPGDLMKAVMKVHQYSSTCCTTFLHVGMAGAMELEETGQRVKEMAAIFAERRKILLQGLDRIPFLSYIKPYGAFYTMVDVSRTGMDGDAYAERLLEEKQVAVIPASSMGRGCGDFVRLSFAASEDTIRQALKRMGAM